MAQVTLRINDVEPVSGQLVGVLGVLEVLLALGYASTEVNWSIRRGVWGHGPWVCGVEDQLVELQTVPVAPGELLEALRSGEYFFDVWVDFADGPVVSFGLVDSTFLFVTGQDHALRLVAREFGDTDIGPWAADTGVGPSNC